MTIAEEEIQMHVDPSNVLPGYIVKIPIYIGILFCHDDLNQISDVRIVCLPSLIDKLNWARVKEDIGALITSYMVEITKEKK